METQERKYKQKLKYEVRCLEPGEDKDYLCETFDTRAEALAYIESLHQSSDDKLYEHYFVVEVDLRKEDLYEVREYRRRLVEALKSLKDEGKRTWNDDDIGQIMRSYSNNMIKDAVAHISPEELAEKLSM